MKKLFALLCFLGILIACSGYEPDAIAQTSQASTDCGHAVIFDDADGGPSNIRSDRAAQSPLTNTVTGATSFGSTFTDDVGPHPGVVASDYATVGGGAGNYVQEGATGAVIPGGIRCDVRAPYAYASGYRCFGDGIASFCHGYANVAVADYSTAIGVSGYARGRYSFSQGFACSAGDGPEDEGSIAMGYNNHTSAKAAVALGYQSEGDGMACLAGGGFSRCSSDYAFAWGGACEASGYGSTAVGIGAKAKRWGEFAHGGYSAGEGGQFHRVALNAHSFNGGVVELRLQGDFPTFSLDADKAYLVRVHILGRRTDAPGIWSEIHHVLAAADSALAIAEDTTVSTGGSGGSCTIRASGGLALSVECAAAPATHMKFTASVEWTALE